MAATVGRRVMSGTAADRWRDAQLTVEDVLDDANREVLLARLAVEEGEGRDCAFTRQVLDDDVLLLVLLAAKAEQARTSRLLLLGRDRTGTTDDRRTSRDAAAAQQDSPCAAPLGVAGKADFEPAFEAPKGSFAAAWRGKAGVEALPAERLGLAEAEQRSRPDLIAPRALPG
jgi:hypothetical protein